nr:hypothetical protein [Legionella norrlandica]
MDIRKIRKLIELLEETGISEIEIKEGEESLRLSRHNPTSTEATQIHYMAPPPMKQTLPIQPSGPSITESPVADDKQTASTLRVIKSVPPWSEQCTQPPLLIVHLL